MADAVPNPRSYPPAPGLAQAGAAKVHGTRESFGDISLSTDEAATLCAFLRDEITRAEAETRSYRDNMILWREFVEPRPRQKSFPWVGASSVFVPIPRIVLDALKASIKQTITKQKRLFVAEMVSPDYAGIDPGHEFAATEAAVAFAEHVALDPGFLDLKRVIDEWTEEMLITGIGALKVTLDDDTRTLRVRGGEREVTFHKGPRIFVVPTATWVWPAGLWHNVQEMPWVGNWVALTEGALRARTSAPWSYLPEAVDATISSGGELLQSDPDTQSRYDAGGQMPSTVGHRIYEVYYVCDPHRDGIYHDLVITYSLRANRILRIVYGDGAKPYEVEVASPRSGTVFGRGVIEPIVQPCRAINTAVNQTFDAQTLANAPSLRYPEDSNVADTLASGFYPGLQLAYKEETAEIDVLKFPEPSASSYQTVAFFQSIISQLTRIGPNRLGEVSEGRRTPATLGLATQQLGAELIDELIDRIRDTIGRVMSRALTLYYESDPDIFERVLGVEGGALLRMIVDKSVKERRSLSESIRIRLFASSATRSAELDKQNALAIAQMTMTRDKEVIGLMQLFAQSPPEYQRILVDIVRANEEQMRRIVELTDQPDPRRIIPDVSGQLEALIVPAPPPTIAPSPLAAPPVPPETLAALAGAIGGAPAGEAPAGNGGPPAP